MQEEIVKPFSEVTFEIVGKCNAKCTYCITGNGSQTGTYVDIAKFKEVIQGLYEKKLVNENTNFLLYNWGEPLLHPEFSDIIKFLSESNIKFLLSSNLSIIPKNLTSESFVNLQNFTISMPGFSQNSYSKIHGFNFFKILENIELLMKYIPKEKITVAFHIYQFNISEIKLAQEYFKNLGIKVFSSFAYFNDYNMATQYLTNSLSPIEMQKVSKELLLFYVDDLVSKMPKDYSCPQYEYLNIDENCNVITCCAAPKNSKDYFVSSANSIDMKKLQQRNQLDICQECYKTKLVYWAHNTAQVSTDFIYRIVK